MKKLKQTITLLDADTVNGFVTLQKAETAHFWLYELCEVLSRENSCKKDVLSDKEQVFTYTRSEIKNLQEKIDWRIRNLSRVKFPSTEFMDKFENMTSRSPESQELFGELAEILCFLAPLATMNSWIDHSKKLKIKFKESE